MRRESPTSWRVNSALARCACRPNPTTAASRQSVFLTSIRQPFSIGFRIHGHSPARRWPRNPR